MANPILAELEATVRNTNGVIDSAIAFVNGVPGLIQAAVEQALANGATAEELAPFTVLEADLEAKATDLANAIASNPSPSRK